MWFIFCIVIIVIDQVTKWVSVEHLSKVGTVPIIENVLNFTYVENTGAAFGILSGQTWLFVIITVIAVIGILFYYVKGTQKKDVLLRLSLMLILAGAVGNCIDRVFRGFVVDMIDVALINFYVFNVADIAVCIGVALMAVHVIFFEGKHAV